MRWLLFDSWYTCNISCKVWCWFEALLIVIHTFPKSWTGAALNDLQAFDFNAADAGTFKIERIILNVKGDEVWKLCVVAGQHELPIGHRQFKWLNIFRFAFFGQNPHPNESESEFFHTSYTVTITTYCAGQMKTNFFCRPIVSVKWKRSSVTDAFWAYKFCKSYSDIVKFCSSTYGYISYLTFKCFLEIS